MGVIYRWVICVFEPLGRSPLPCRLSLQLEALGVRELRGWRCGSPDACDAGRKARGEAVVDGDSVLSWF